ncbi:MAG: hypothetical protein Kow0040_05610 [Thermogutta sp.]
MGGIRSNQGNYLPKDDPRRKFRFGHSAAASGDAEGEGRPIPQFLEPLAGDISIRAKQGTFLIMGNEASSGVIDPRRRHH